VSDIKETDCGIEYKLTEEGIEIGTDVSFDSDYADCYCIHFSIEQLERLLNTARKGGKV